MKYLAALLIGIGLLAHNPAFAERLKFEYASGIRMEACVRAATDGFELALEDRMQSRMFLKGPYKTDDRKNKYWKIYEIRTEWDGPDPIVSCTERPSE